MNDVALHKIKDIGVITIFIIVYIVFYQYVSTGSINNIINLPNEAEKLVQDTFLEIVPDTSQEAVTESSQGTVPDTSQDTASYPSSVPVSNNSTDTNSIASPDTSVIDPDIDSNTDSSNTTDSIEPMTHRIRMDINGFYPDVITINVMDSISWTNFENQRTRVVLISKDDLFEKQVMLDGNRFEYQFRQKGNYTFVLADPPSENEYPKAKGNVIVN